jgi:hypothetical protein
MLPTYPLQASSSFNTVAWWTLKLLAMARALSPASSRLRPSVCCLPVSLGFLPKLYDTGLGNGTAGVGPANNALTLILGERAQEGDEATADGGRQIQVRLVEDFDQRAPLVDALDDVDTVERVARSHSATTRTSRVPSSSMAFSSCGRLRMSLALAFSRKIASQRSALRASICLSRF